METYKKKLHVRYKLLILMLTISLHINFMTNTSDEQNLMSGEIKIKPLALNQDEQSWVSKTLAAISTMMYGAPKIAIMQDVSHEQSTSHVNVIKQEIGITPDHSILDVEEYFNDYGEGKKLYPELAKFIRNFRCNKEFEEDAFLLMQQGSNRSRYRQFYEGQDFLIKGKAVDRIINACRMKNYFEKNNIEHLAVADKCLVLNKDSLFLMSRKIEFGDQKTPISSKEADELAQFGLDTGYWDWQFGSNVIRDIQGKLIFVDTEDFAFEYPYFLHDKENILKSLLLNLKDAHQKEAFFDIYKKYKKIKNSDEGHVLIMPLLYKNSMYDDPGINFEQVKKEFKKFEESK